MLCVGGNNSLALDLSAGTRKECDIGGDWSWDDVAANGSLVVRRYAASYSAALDPWTGKFVYQVQKWLHVSIASPDGKLIARTCPTDDSNPIEIVDRDGQVIRTIKAPDGANGFGAAAWAPNGESFFIFRFRALEEYRVSDGTRIRAQKDLTPYDEGVDHLTISLDGQHAIFGTDKRWGVIRLSDLQILWDVKAKLDPRNRAFVPKASAVAVKSGAELLFLSVADGKQMGRLAMTEDSEDVVAFSPDGTYLMVPVLNHLEVWAQKGVPRPKGVEPLPAPPPIKPPAKVPPAAPPAEPPKKPPSGEPVAFDKLARMDVPRFTADSTSPAKYQWKKEANSDKAILGDAQWQPSGTAASFRYLIHSSHYYGPTRASAERGRWVVDFLDSTGRYLAICTSADGKRMVAIDDPSVKHDTMAVHLLEGPKWKETASGRLSARSDPIYGDPAHALDASGGRLAVGDTGDLIVFSVPSWKEQLRVSVPGGHARWVSFAGARQERILVASEDRLLTFDAERGELLGAVERPRGACGLSTWEGQFVLALPESNKVLVIDASGGGRVGEIGDTPRSPAIATISPDARWLLVEDTEGQLVVRRRAK